MIIDCHAHVSAPAKLWAYKATLLAHRGAHGRGKVVISDDELVDALNTPTMGKYGHLPYLKENGIDKQCVSPRPFQMMHSESPAKIVDWLHAEVHNVIYRQTQMYPDTFVGVAGLSQVAGRPIEDALPELERAVNELGFRGCLLNPDPYENGAVEAPGLGEKYWYPLYEKLCELDIPAHIHSAGSRSERTAYSLHFINEETIAIQNLMKSTVYDDFPDLKIICSHGGGAIPYQIGRFDAGTARGKGLPFREKIKKMYFDTVLYSPAALELLIKEIGADNLLFGAECPGVGSSHNAATGRPYDDIKPYIDGFEWLSDEDRTKIYSGNSIKIFGLDK
ncbi:MAG: amidohydrolase [Kordiimonadaceae bacterium]|jgi:OH-DDVA meta-cleavage compound hydrolase|nr:amidohydrolase [Kordiimonadaceae bacterium]MBT6032471.1 amidohydrolase [Kordiimonadaceae bacterium]